MKNRRHRIDTVCCGPLCDACKYCPEFFECYKSNSGEPLRYSTLPHFIVDHLLMDKDINKTAICLYIFLNRRVGFQKGRSNYGKAYLTYEQISAATHISKNYIGKYTKLLQDKGLISHECTIKVDSTGKYFTQHEFEVRWRKDIDNLKERYDEIMQ